MPRRPAGTSRPHYNVIFAVLPSASPPTRCCSRWSPRCCRRSQADLHTTQNTVTWVLTAYLLSASVFTPIMGRIGDMVGKERVLRRHAGRAGRSGSLLAALATTIGVMIVARVIQGIGGGVLPLAFGIIRDEFPREKVTGAVGAIASLTAVGGGLGHRAGRPDRQRASTTTGCSGSR